MKVVVLGAGLVGGPMALDLAKDPGLEVTVVDRREDVLERLWEASGRRLRTSVHDLSQTGEVQALARTHDLVLSAVPGFMGFRTLEAVLETGRS